MQNSDTLSHLRTRRSILFMLIGAFVSLPMLASAEQIVFEPDQTIRAEPFNVMFDELYSRVEALEVDIEDTVPPGAIVMWSGTFQDIPAGWAPCTGETDTPDLRDRFIVGAGNSYEIDTVGGEAMVTLSIDEMPSHSHSFSYLGSSPNPFQLAGWPGPPYQDPANLDGNTDAVGGGEAHENRPPYYALAYIMKL